MSAIFGIVGEFSRTELEAMGERLAHKGNNIETWSPARNVGFGEIRYWPRNADEDANTAASVHLDVDWSTVDDRHFADARARDEYRRSYLARCVDNDAVSAPVTLDGMFAFAHWESAGKRLILAVDRVNYENIYYARTRNAFAFSSDYKSLLALPDVRISPDADALQHAIAVSSIDLSTTLAAGIRRIPRCHLLIVNGHSEEAIPYWRAYVRPKRISRQQASSRLREILTEKIRQSASPFEKVAVTLSGGLDSSGLIALIRHAHPDKPISTYTIGHSDEDPEIVGARESAKHFGTDHNELIFDPESIADDLPRLVWLTEELAGCEEMILQYQVERYLIGRENVIVSGSGADMVFAGMPRHRLVRMAETVPFAKRPLTELFQQTQSGVLPETLRGKIASWLLYRGQQLAPPRLRGAKADTTVFEPDSLDAFIAETIVEMDSLHYHSATRSQAPIESLLPFLSNAVLNYSLTIPSKLKASVFTQKIVLRDALSSLLPDSIRNRKKAIQRARNDRQLTEVLDRMADNLLSQSSLENRGLISEKYVSRIRRKQSSGAYDRVRLNRLWMLLVCELWCRTFIDNRGRPL